MDLLLNSIRGFCMALADSVPGVSGGTIAFILGFYDKFINSLDDLIHGDLKKKKEAIFFLMKLAVGWIFGIILAVLLLTKLFETHIYAVSSLFIGFILFSIPLIIKEEKDTLKGKYVNFIFTIIGIAIVAFITYFNPMSGEASSVDIANINFGLAIYMFIAAMISISAMVLPGISGSTLMLIFGLYVPLISSIKEILNLNFESLPALIIMAFGVIIGIVLVIRLIKIALEKYRSATIYFILGLMLGSIYAIIMGPTTLEAVQSALSFKTFNIFFFLFGGIIVLSLERLKLVLMQRQDNKRKD